MGSSRLKRRWVRIGPHVIDTGLLASALYLVHLTGQLANPMAWLLVKVGLVVLYIVLGVFALKRARTVLGKAIAFGGAMAVFGYIISVALTKSPLPWA